MSNEINFIEVCQILGKSKRTISRYIASGKLKPEKIKSKKGTVKYIFDRNEINNFSNEMTGQNQKIIKNDDDTLTLLRETIKMLNKELKEKNSQIKKAQAGEHELRYLLNKEKEEKERLLLPGTNQKEGKREESIDRTQANKWHIKNIINKIFKRKGD
jgi:predicted DNA-binding transcriptional regulator AlpA